MIQASFRLARIRGIEIGVHYSWFVILVLITVSLARVFPALRYILSPFAPGLHSPCRH